MILRCPWCTARATGGACTRCTTEILPDTLYGPARVLVESGVDRLSLAARARLLPAAEREAYAARIDAQRRVMSTRVAELELVESSLLQRGFAEDLDDALALRLPLRDDALRALAEGPRPPFAGLEALRAIAASSPIEDTRALAAIALLRRGEATRAHLDQARRALEGGDRRLCREAALALGHWRVRRSPELPRLSSWDQRRLGEVLDELVADPHLGPWAAVARGDGAEDQLRCALAAADPELRFAAALVLGDEPELERALDGPDDRVREAALDTLGRLGSRVLHERLRAAPDEEKLGLLDVLRRPPDEALSTALIHTLDGSGEEVQRRVLRFFTSSSSSQVSAPARARLGEALARSALGAEELFSALEWASDDPGSIALALSEKLELTPRPALVALLEAHRFTLRRWIGAGGPRGHALLQRWLDDEALAPLALEAAIQAEAAAPLLALWNDADKPAVAARFRAAFERHRSSFLREQIVPVLWQRFKDHPAERAAVMNVLSVFRGEVQELRSLEPKAGPFGPRDLVSFYALYALNDPLGAPEHLAYALEQARLERGAARRDHAQLAALAELVLPHATRLAATHPCTAGRIAANLFSHTVNALREHPRDAALVQAVGRLRAAHPALSAAFDAARPEDPSEARYSHLIEQLETELHLAAEAEERVRRQDEEQVIRAAEQTAREARERARAAEARAQELEARASATEARVTAAEARLQVVLAQLREAEERLGALREELRAGTPAPPPRRGPPRYLPNVPLEGLDDEPLLPDQPLSTLLEYAGFLKQLGEGGDVMALFARHGLDPLRWAACSTAWSSILSTRMNVAMRFSAIFQATWSLRVL